MKTRPAKPARTASADATKMNVSQFDRLLDQGITPTELRKHKGTYIIGLDDFYAHLSFLCSLGAARFNGESFVRMYS